MTHTRALAELRQADAERFGGKSAGLGELIAAQILVPPGFALAATAYRAWVAEAGEEDRIAKVAELEPGDVDAINATAHSLSETMRFAPVPHAVREELTRRYAELAEALGQPEPPVAVRSSALGEDSQQATFAGQQESYLWVRGLDAICDAVRDCWLSLYSPTAISYRARLPSAVEGPAMGVTVQLMVDAETSGVMFTCNPVSGDPSMVAVNASWGLGLAVVGGEVTPDDYLVSKVTVEVVRQRVNPKLIAYVPDPEGRGAVRQPVPPERQEIPCLRPDQLAELVALARRVERHFGSRQDIEWAIARTGELPSNLFVVQSRPVTVVPGKASPEPASALELVMRRFGA